MESIDDEFSQVHGVKRRYRMRLKAAGKCRECSKPVAPNRMRCEMHLKAARQSAIKERLLDKLI